MLARLTGAAARVPLVTVAVVAALSLAGGLLALSLKPSVADNTLVSSSSAGYQATEADDREFGGDAVIVLVRTPVSDLVESDDLVTISRLEACLSGEVLAKNRTLGALEPAPRGSLAPYGGSQSPCAALMRDRPAQVVYGPGTFLNRAVASVNQQVGLIRAADQRYVSRAARAAYRLALARGLSSSLAKSAALAAAALEAQRLTAPLEKLALSAGVSSAPSISDSAFVSRIVFGTSGPPHPKPLLAYLFPTANAALIQVRLRANLTTAQSAQAISLIRAAVAMPEFRLGHGGTYTVTGEPVVLDELATQITGSIALLVLGAIVAMGLALALVFRGTMRLLPLAVAVAATAITFGVAALAGAGLTIATVAALPILIGLAVDYAIQFQSRAREAPSADAGEAVRDAAVRGAPTITAAALATAVGFLVLLLSPVPMVRGFAVVIVIGIAVALLVTLTAGAAALVLPRSDLGVLGASVRGAREILADARSAASRRRPAATGRARPPARPQARKRTRGTAATHVSWAARLTRHPGRVLAVAAALALLGWFADTQTPVSSDITKLVPANTPALRDLDELERVSGVSGEIDVTVHGTDVATPATVAWMTAYERRLLAHFGYSQARGCARAILCPALSLPDLFAGTGSPVVTRRSITELLTAVPRYFSQAVITANHRSAVLAFGIRLMPLSEQQRVIVYMRSQLHPPSGVDAQLAGLPVLAADANAALSSSGRRLLTALAALLAVALTLLVVFREPRRALVPLVPIALASGWSALILFLVGVPLNPMSATLGALVIAISTEFSVLLSERYRQERLGGGEPAEALRRAYRSTGAAVLASGITVIAGFGVLVLSDITMLRDFGFVTVIDMSVSLAGVLLVLPAVLALAERGDDATEPLNEPPVRGRPAARRRRRPTPVA